jgi:TonB-dependent receptor
MINFQQLWGADNRIEGKVTDVATGEPLFGANIILDGTSMGAATDFEGEYLIANVPAGSYTLRASYIGYESKEIKIELKENVRLQVNVELEAVSISTTDIVVTAQAQGQNAAINQQLSSDNIVNVVSSARIQELPDANAAESIGRLPGISLVREGGQATKVVVRGLSPEFNQITINGVPIPSNEGDVLLPGSSDIDPVGGGRGTDMRMVSSNMLDEIQVFKTNTPDMDAAVLGGTVNLGIRKAKKGLSEQPLGLPNIPAVSFQAQGGFTNLTNEYNNYKFDLTLEKRFFDERFGVLVQGIVQHQNLTSDRLDIEYTQLEPANNPDRLGLTHVNLYFYPRTEKRYNGTITLDYDIPNGSLALTNILSQNKTDGSHYRQRMGIGQRGGNSFNTYAGKEERTLNLITNILSYSQKNDWGDIDATFSHSYSENIEPDSWELIFDQLSAGTDDIDIELDPVIIAEKARQHMILDETKLRNVRTTSNNTKQRDLRASVDFKKNFNIADFLSVELKTGGMYGYTNRSHDHEYGYGYIYFGQLGKNIVKEFPWLQTDWGVDPNTASRFPIEPFLDNDVNFGTFLDDNYKFDYRLNLDLIQRIKEIAVGYGKTFLSPPTGGNPSWVPNMFDKLAYDYSGKEYRSAGYLMGTFNIGQIVTLLAGVRYQNLTTEYTGYRCYNAGQSNTYPNPYLGLYDTTFTKSHGYWLPSFHLNFKPLSWLSLRAAYTNTLAYPNFNAIIPILRLYTDRVDWNDVSLKPIRSKNLDLQLSAYSNELGLFTFGGFVKYLDDFIFWQRKYIIDPNEYEGLHDVPGQPNMNVKGYRVDTYYNNTNQVEVWGIESDWQTHFWYLPGILSGFVLNINYTHNFSEATYPRSTVSTSGFPPVTTYNDTTYTDALINQPDDIINVSLGWDYKDFSILFSIIYQSGIFHRTDFWPTYRVDKDKYTRFDLAAKQRLPWNNIELFLNINNLNGANDTYIQRGNSFPQSDYSYGLTAQLGFRIKFH